MALAVHVFNRTPRRMGAAISLLEAVKGQSHDLEHIRVFRCLAYVHIPSRQRQMMDPPSRKGIFVCFTPNITSWMVYIPETQDMRSS